MLVFVEGAKPENPKKNPRTKDENQQQTQPTYDAESGNRTRATLVGGECTHHFAIFAVCWEDRYDMVKDDKKCGVGEVFFPILVWDAPAADVKVESHLTPLTSQTMV